MRGVGKADRTNEDRRKGRHGGVGRRKSCRGGGRLEAKKETLPQLLAYVVFTFMKEKL